MPTLVILRGLPGSGKSTYARSWVNEDITRRARVNRDTLRIMLHDGKWKGQPTEKQIMAARDATITTLLKQGIDVISDDTNLPNKTVRDLKQLATNLGAGFEIVDLTDIPVDVCVQRDRLRPTVVGEQVIRELHSRYVRGREYPLPFNDLSELVIDIPERYVTPKFKPYAIIVDIDGTIAHMNGRSPYDWSRVGEDSCDLAVLEIIRWAAVTGHTIVFCSGRDESCRDITEQWIKSHVAKDYEGVMSWELFMRPVGDNRKDSIVKLELFNKYIRNEFAVLFVLDDRNQVVDMWRSLGLKTLQVEPGDF